MLTPYHVQKICPPKKTASLQAAMCLKIGNIDKPKRKIILLRISRTMPRSIQTEYFYLFLFFIFYYGVFAIFYIFLHYFRKVFL